MPDASVPDDLPTPLPLVIAPDDETHAAFFGDGEATPETPIGAAFLWWSALLNLDEFRTALERLSYNPADWDYPTTQAHLSGWALASGLIERDEPHPQIAAAKFIRDTGWSMQAFDDAPLDEVVVLTVVLCPDGWWRVWGMSKNHVPSNNRVLHGTE